MLALHGFQEYLEVRNYKEFSLFHWHVQNVMIRCLFSGASSISLCYVLFPATLLHQLFFHSLSPHLAIYFLVSLS